MGERPLQTTTAVTVTTSPPGEQTVPPHSIGPAPTARLARQACHTSLHLYVVAMNHRKRALQIAESSGSSVPCKTKGDTWERLPRS